MPAAPTDLSPVAAVTAILAALIGPEILPYASAYAVIGAGAFLGALVGLFRRAPARPAVSICFVIVAYGVSMGCTVPLAQWIAQHLDQPMTWLFFPVAFVVAAIGDDWLKLPLWAWISDALTKKFKGPPNGA